MYDVALLRMQIIEQSDIVRKLVAITIANVFKNWRKHDENVNHNLLGVAAIPFWSTAHAQWSPVPYTFLMAMAAFLI